MSAVSNALDPAVVPTNVRIRTFRSGDQPAVRSLVLDGLRHQWGEVDPSLNRDLDDLTSADARGRTLVAELVRVARSWGVDRVVLETTATWTDTVAFYLACGFSITHDDDGRFGRDTWFELRLA